MIKVLDDIHDQCCNNLTYMTDEHFLLSLQLVLLFSDISSRLVDAHKNGCVELLLLMVRT
jgi:hypothetical protein